MSGDRVTASAPDGVRDFRRARARRPVVPFEALMRTEAWGPGRLEDAEKIAREGWKLARFDRLLLRAPVAWDEVAAANRSWHYHLMSWEPLSLALRAHSETGESRWIEYVLPLALDWLASYPSRETDSPFAWYDMAVGLRAYRLGYLLDVVARDERYGAAEIARLIDGAVLHAEVLADDSLFRGHNNHGLYQAAGQLALARRFPELVGMDAARRQGADRLELMLGQQFAADGTHREHSPGYHLLLLDALERLTRAGLLPDGTTGLVGRVRSALPWFVQPSGRLAPIGDTDMAMSGREPFDDAQDPAVRFVATAGAEGEPPEAVVRAFPSGGYAVLRDRWPDGAEDYRGCSHICQITGFHSTTHRHADDLSFTWYERGVEVLGDAGRFGYLYDDPRRRYVVSTRAHNTVSIDGEDRPAGARDAYGSGLRSVGASGPLRFSEAVAPAGTAEHRRVLAWHPGVWLLVVDLLEDGSGVAHQYTQRFVVAPEHEVRLDGDGFVIDVEGADRPLAVRSFTGDARSEVVLGQEEPDLLGWISRRYLQTIPTPTFAFTAGGAGSTVLATLFAWSADPVTVAAPEGGFAEGRARGRLGWMQGSERHEVSVSGETDLTVGYTRTPA